MKRIMGLDVGEKYIGIAISDPLRITAQGLQTLIRENIESDCEKIASLSREYQVELLVIGLPRNINGSLGPAAQKVQEFGLYLQQKVELSVKYWDERFSTLSVHKMLITGDVSRKKRKKVVDKLAAVIILQNYLDSIK
ncbi:MAG: Holliday junction resolvase RuvX [Bacillota bacterium]